MKTIINAAEASSYINAAEQELAEASTVLRDFGNTMTNLSTHWRVTKSSNLGMQYVKVTEAIKDAINTMTGYSQSNEGIVSTINKGIEGTGVTIALTPGNYIPGYVGFPIYTYTDKIGIEDGNAVIDIISNQGKYTTSLQAKFTAAIQNYQRLWACANEVGNSDVSGLAHEMAKSIRGISNDFGTALASYTSLVTEDLEHVKASTNDQKQLTNDQVNDLTKRLGRMSERLTDMLPSADRGFAAPRSNNFG